MTVDRTGELSGTRPFIMGRTTERAVHVQEAADLEIEVNVEPFAVGEKRLLNGDEINQLPEPGKYLVDTAVIVETSAGYVQRLAVYEVTRLSDDPEDWT